jgi:hypothetical protein
MKKNYLLAIILCHFTIVYGQDEVSVNFVDIKSKIENTESESSYSKLLKRFNDFDPSLSVQDYSLIYYGFSFQENYLKNMENEYQLENTLKAKDYEKLIIDCQKVLDENPVSLSANDKMGFALKRMNRPPAEWVKYQKRYKKLREAIIKSGNGLTPNTAIKVIYVSDERIILKDYFGVPNIREQSSVGSCDKFIIEPSEKYKSQEIYFDISRKIKRQEELLHKN